MNEQYIEQWRREKERTLSPLGKVTSEANRDRELWRSVLATAFPEADPGDVESPIYRVQKLAQAVENRINWHQRGQPPTLVATYKKLAELSSVENWPTAVDWALISFGCALKAMIEIMLLDETGGDLSILRSVDEADTYLNDEIARRYSGILIQDIHPEDNRALMKRATEFAREWRRLPVFRNKSRNDNVALALRAMVEFIAIYSGLFVGSEKRHRSVGDWSLSPTEFFRQNVKRCQIDQLGMKKNHPMLVTPTRWSKGQRGGHLVAPNHLYKLSGRNAIQADLRHIVDKQDFPIVFEAANALQNTGWRVNDRVLKTVDQIYHSLPEDALPEDLASLRKASKKKKSDFDDTSQEWKEASRLDQDGFAWRSGICDLAKQSAFYFPYQLDYRGRLYPLAAWLDPQGDDLSKGLLEFSTGKLVKSQEAWQLLALHGSQCVPTGDISKEIELGNGETPSLVDRERWVRLHEGDIIACADNPIQNTWWLTTSKSKCRWQFLAFCLAWTSAKRGEPCHLPVYVDGSCNGLQHMAALLRDRTLAKHTNLLPSERPQDTYTWVQMAVESSIGDEAGRQDAIYGNIAKWVQAHQVLDRDAAKKVVMVFSYGSDLYKDHLLEHLKEMEKEKSKKYGNERWWETPGSPAWDAGHMWWCELFCVLGDLQGVEFIPYSRYISGWDEKNKEKEKLKEKRDTKKTKKDLDNEKYATTNSEYRFPECAELVDGLEKIKHGALVNHIDGLLLRNFLYDRLASFLTKHFSSAMQEQLIGPVNLRQWLRECCKAVVKETQLPMTWTSPVDLPVIQITDEFFDDPDKDDGKIDTTSLKVLEDGLDEPRLIRVIDNIEGRRQIPVPGPLPNRVSGTSLRTHQDSFPPNLIHSLDASHLIWTVCRGLQLGIGSFAAVHDSFGTHAEDAPILALALRDSFMRLHRVPILMQLLDWLELLRNPKLAAPIELTAVQGELLAVWRQNWQTNPVFKLPDANPSEPLKEPPISAPDAAFDIDEIGKSKYIFY